MPSPPWSRTALRSIVRDNRRAVRAIVRTFLERSSVVRRNDRIVPTSQITTLDLGPHPTLDDKYSTVDFRRDQRDPNPGGPIPGEQTPRHSSCDHGHRRPLNDVAKTTQSHAHYRRPPAPRSTAVPDHSGHPKSRRRPPSSRSLVRRPTAAMKWSPSLRSPTMVADSTRTPTTVMTGPRRLKSNASSTAPRRDRRTLTTNP